MRLIETFVALTAITLLAAAVLVVLRQFRRTEFLARERDRLELQASAISASANSIMITDADGRIEWVNPAFAELSGYHTEEVIGQTPRLLKSGRQSPEEYAAMWQRLKSGEVWRGELVERRRDGSFYTVNQSITPMRDAGGDISHYVVVQEDISGRKRAEDRLRYLTNYDALTALPNRRLFLSRLDQILERTDGRAAVLVVQIETLDRINEALGHMAGDLLLQSMVERLNRVARQADVIGRVGGNSFGLAFTMPEEPESIAGLVGKLVADMTQPATLPGGPVQPNAHAGISLFPDDGNDAGRLLGNAELALLRAGKAQEQFCFFSPDMDNEARIRLQMEADLMQALRAGEFYLAYQPVVALEPRKLVGFEALLRWRKENGEDVPPGRFIPIAEESRLILPIGEWILDEACRQLAEWRAEGKSDISLAVNLSTVQLQSASLPDTVAQALDRHAIPASALELEITESALMRDPHLAQTVIAQLRDLGTGIAIDDFGTGYSSLAYLKQFPATKLKVDQSFVRGIPGDPRDCAIASSIIALGHALQMRVVAEGVETEAQFEALRQMGCNLVQGHLTGLPKPGGLALAINRL